MAAVVSGRLRKLKVGLTFSTGVGRVVTKAAMVSVMESEESHQMPLAQLSLLALGLGIVTGFGGDLTHNLQVSRGSVREALKRLAAEGIVTLTLHRSAFIRALQKDEAKKNINDT
jgi:hypothetical protein